MRRPGRSRGLSQGRRRSVTAPARLPHSAVSLGRRRHLDLRELPDQRVARLCRGGEEEDVHVDLIQLRQAFRSEESGARLRAVPGHLFADHRLLHLASLGIGAHVRIVPQINAEAGRRLVHALELAVGDADEIGPGLDGAHVALRHGNLQPLKLVRAGGEGADALAEADTVDGLLNPFAALLRRFDGCRTTVEFERVNGF